MAAGEVEGAVVFGNTRIGPYHPGADNTEKVEVSDPVTRRLTHSSTKVYQHCEPKRRGMRCRGHALGSHAPLSTRFSKLKFPAPSVIGAGVGGGNVVPGGREGAAAVQTADHVPHGQARFRNRGEG